MSHWKNFCGAGDDRQFLFIVTRFGELASAQLDKDGKPINWSMGRIEDVVAGMLREHFPHAVVDLNRYFCPRDLFYGCARWRDVCETLNHKSLTVGKRRAEWWLEQFSRDAFGHIERLSGKWHPTEKGRKYDAEADEKRAALNV